MRLARLVPGTQLLDLLRILVLWRQRRQGIVTYHLAGNTYHVRRPLDRAPGPAPVNVPGVTYMGDLLGVRARIDRLLVLSNVVFLSQSE